MRKIFCDAKQTNAFYGKMEKDQRDSIVSQMVSDYNKGVVYEENCWLWVRRIKEVLVSAFDDDNQQGI